MPVLPDIVSEIAPPTVRVMLNGEPVVAAAQTLQELLDATGFGGEKVATALNGDFVPARARAAQALADGDHIEVVAARQGG